MCDLKKVFVSRTTCSNAAHQLVDRLFLLCWVDTVQFRVHKDGVCRLINLHLEGGYLQF